MTTLLDAAKQALEALEFFSMEQQYGTLHKKAATALRAAIEQAEKAEPERLLSAVDHILNTAETVEGYRSGVQLLKLMLSGGAVEPEGIKWPQKN